MGLCLFYYWGHGSPNSVNPSGQHCLRLRQVANRLTSGCLITHTWDANGNLLADGVFTYTYDAANRLIDVTTGLAATTFAYNGPGDRVNQTVAGVVTTYTLDLNTGLTQVLAD